jgi:hypothetical protein
MVIRWLAACALLLSGCINASMACPSGKSTVTYKGVALFGNTAVSCVQSLTGGDIAQISGVDIAALAAMVAPMVLMAQPPGPGPKAVPSPEPEPENDSFNL